MVNGSLWSNINFVTPELANVMLERSRSAPLSVQVFYNNPSFTNTLAQVLAQAERLRFVELVGLMEKKVISKFSRAAPMLEDLVLKFAGYEPTNIPIDFLGEGAPNLRRLVVEGFGIPQWSRFPLVPSLTQLRLRSSNWEETRPTAKAFLEYLKQMPNLKSLELVNFLPYPESTPLPCIDIPTLRAVRFEDSMAAISSFSSAVRMRRVSSVRLILKDEGNRGGHLFDTLLAALSKNWRTKEHNNASTLCIEEDYTRLGNGLTFDFTVDIPIDEKLSPTDNPTFCLSIDHPAAPTKAEYLLPIATTLVNCSSLRILRLAPSREVSPSDWTVLGGLDSLERIILAGASTRTFFQALKSNHPPLATAGHPLESPKARPLFPALSTLELQDVGSLRATSPQSRNSLLDLINALKGRPQSHRIKTLLIGGQCSSSQAAYDLIVGSLPEVSVVWHRGFEEAEGGELDAEESSGDEDTDEEDSEVEEIGDGGSGNWEDTDDDEDS
jgi:hypothetical protein